MLPPFSISLLGPDLIERVVTLLGLGLMAATMSAVLAVCVTWGL